MKISVLDHFWSNQFLKRCPKLFFIGGVALDWRHLSRPTAVVVVEPLVVVPIPDDLVQFFFKTWLWRGPHWSGLVFGIVQKKCCRRLESILSPFPVWASFFFELRRQRRQRRQRRRRRRRRRRMTNDDVRETTPNAESESFVENNDVGKIFVGAKLRLEEILANHEWNKIWIGHFEIKVCNNGNNFQKPHRNGRNNVQPTGALLPLNNKVFQWPVLQTSFGSKSPLTWCCAKD